MGEESSTSIMIHMFTGCYWPVLIFSVWDCYKINVTKINENVFSSDHYKLLKTVLVVTKRSLHTIDCKIFVTLLFHNFTENKLPHNV